MMTKKKKTVSGKAFDLSVLKRLYQFIKPYRKQFRVAAALTILLAFLSPARPILIQRTIDNYVFKSDSSGFYMTTISLAFASPAQPVQINIPIDKYLSQANNHGLQMMIIIMVALLFFQTLIQYYFAYLTSLLGQIVIKDLRVKLFRHISDLRLKFFDHTPIGTLVTRTISDLETIADIFSEGLINIIGDLLQLVVIIAVMFIVDWRLALVSLSTIPVLIVATRLFQHGINKTFREVRTQVAALNTFVQEHITGMNIVQSFNREDEEMRRFGSINKDHMKAHIRSVWYYSIFFPVVELLSATSLGLLVWWGSHGVITHEVSFGNVVAFMMFIGMLFRPMRELADKFNTLQMGMVSSERVFKLLDTHENISNTGTIKNSIDGKIEFKNVWFAYNELPVMQDASPEWILKDVSFKVDKGETLALIGATGAGKSSIINLVGRLYEFQQGEICIDDIDIRKYDLFSLRRQIAVVLQDVFLFSDTILNNITLNDPTVKRDEVIEAAKVVGAHDFIMRLPGNYDFNVMERGAMLSVGQRQLISFIRAYVFNPKILILDEATSSIDSESEELIQQATSKLTYKRTSIVIAHRLATIQNAGRILVLDHGKIVEEGNHQQLLKQNGLYRELYEIQFARTEK